MEFPHKKCLDAFNELKKQVCVLKKRFVLLHNDYLCRHKKESCPDFAILALNTSQNVFRKLNGCFELNLREKDAQFIN